MTTITQRAIYRRGILRLDTPIDLPENTTVQVEITLVSPDQPRPGRRCTGHSRSWQS